MTCSPPPPLRRMLRILPALRPCLGRGNGTRCDHIAMALCYIVRHCSQCDIVPKCRTNGKLIIAVGIGADAGRGRRVRAREQGAEPISEHSTLVSALTREAWRRPRARQTPRPGSRLERASTVRLPASRPGTWRTRAALPPRRPPPHSVAPRVARRRILFTCADEDLGTVPPRR